MTLAAVLIASDADLASATAIRTALQGHGLSSALGGWDESGDPRITDARSAVVLVSPAAEMSEAVRRGVLAALNNARTIIPVLVADVRPESWLRVTLGVESQVDARLGLIPYVVKQVVDAVAAAARAGRVVAMLNMKGGVGKTILTANLFAAAHLIDDRSIAFIDLDPQHNLTQYFLPPSERNALRDEESTVFSVFAGRGPGAAPRAGFGRLVTALNRSPNLGAARLDMVGGDDRLFEYTLDVKSPREKDEAFARWMALVSALRMRYRAVVIDTNPCATFLTRCAIAAADHIVAPVRPERYSLTGLNMLEWVAREIRDRPVRPEEFSVLLNGVGDRVRSRPMGDIDGQTRAEIGMAPFFGSTLIKTAIPYSGLLRATPDDRYAVNPINVTALMRLAQRSLKEALTDAAAEILQRAGA